MPVSRFSRLLPVIIAPLFGGWAAAAWAGETAAKETPASAPPVAAAAPVVSAPPPVQTVIGSAAIPALIEALPERRLPALQRVLTHSLEHAPGLLIQRWNEEQSRANARATRAAMLPNVSGSFTTGPALEIREVENDAGVTTTQESYTLSLFYNAGVSQPLFHWGALSKSYQASQLYAAITARNVEETRRLLAVDLRRRYFDLVLSEGALRLAQKNLAVLREALAFAKTQVEAGFAASSESAVIDQKILVAEIDIQRLTNDRDLLRRNYSRLTGIPLAALPQPEPDTELPAMPAGLGDAINALNPGSVEPPSIRLLNAEDTVRAERLTYEVQKVRLRPKLGLSLSANQDRRSPDGDPNQRKILTTTYGIFATVNWTLFDGYAAQAAQRASLSRLRSYEIDRKLTAAQDTDERRAEIAKLQLSWRLLQESEKVFAGSRSFETLEKDVAAGWVPRSTLDTARRGADVALQSINTARAEFYTTLATFLSNRRADPALTPQIARTAP